MDTLKKYYYHLLRPQVTSSWIGDILLAIPRIICGYALSSGFGADKFGMPWSPADAKLGLFEVAYWFPIDVAEYGGIFAVFPVFFAWMGAFSEAVGGIFLALGWHTRVAAFLIVCTMLVAIFCQQWGGSSWSLLPAAGFLWVGIYHVVIGSGRLGIDYIITKSK